MTETGTDAAGITLSLPPDPRWLRVARQSASAVASLVGYGMGGLENIRVAADEGCLWLLDHGDAGPLELHLTLVAGALEISGSTPTGAVTAPTTAAGDERSALAALIVGAVCAEHRFDLDDTRVSFWLRCHAPGGTSSERDPGTP